MLVEITHKCHSELLQIIGNWSTNVTQNYLKLEKIDPKKLLNFTQKRYSKLVKIHQNWSMNVTQN